MSTQEKPPRECEHKRTQIWEPHLAGARKCLDCGMVYNPNVGYETGNPWYFEPPSLEEQLESLHRERENLIHIRDTQDDEYLALQKQLDEARAELSEMTERHRIVSDTNKLKQGTIQKLQEQRDALKAEREQADADYAELLRERNELKTQLSEANESAGTYRAKWKQAFERLLIESDKTPLLLERNELKTENERLREQLLREPGEKYHMGLNDRQPEIDELKAQLSTAIAALETLRVAVNDKVEDKGATAFIERTLAKLKSGEGKA